MIYQLLLIVLFKYLMVVNINEQQQMFLIKYLTKLCKFLFKKCMKQKKQTRKNIVNNP